MSHTALNPNLGHLGRLSRTGVPFDDSIWPELCDRYRASLSDSAKIQKFEEGGFRNWRSKDGWLYPKLDGSSWTTRIHTKGINVQGLPKGILREAVRAPGNLIVSADWSASHMRLLAHHSGDERLTRDLQDDALYEEVTEAIGLDREEDRGRVKQALLAMLNGQGASARDRLLSGRGARLEHGFKTRWTGAWGFLQNLQMACRAMGWQVVTSDGTVARMPMGKRAEYKAPAGYLQATEADALRKVIKGAEELELRLPVTLVLTVHDETVWLVHDPSRVEECADAIKELMEQALHISPELTQGSVSVSWGPSWGQQDGSKEPPEPPPEPEQDEVLSKTLARLEELHGLNGVCPSPIRLDIEKDGEPVAVLAPCKGYLCPEPSPHLLAC